MLERQDAQDLADLERALLSMDRVAAARAFVGPATSGAAGAHDLLAGAMTPVPLERIDGLLVPALQSIGEGWAAGRVALSQVYMAARIAEALVAGADAAAHPLRSAGPRIGLAVLEDRHELGKRIVSMSLRAAGYGIHDYGAGIGVEALAEQAARDELDVLLVSTLMLRSAMRIAALRRELDALPRRPRLVVGGAPYLFDDTLWVEVGADAMGRSAADAIELVARVGLDGEGPADHRLPAAPDAPAGSAA